MARYYRVSPKFWADPAVDGWTDDSKLLALYLLTSPHRTTEGIFRLPKKYVQADLGWTPERLAKPFGQLLQDGFIEYDEKAQVVLIVQALKYQALDNDNQAKAAVKNLEELPPTPLTSTFKRLAERFSKRLAERLPEGFGERYGDTLALTPTQSPTQKETPTKEPVGPSPEETFKTFWDRYPRHSTNGKPGGGASKHKTAEAWKRLKPSERESCIRAVGNYAKAQAMPDAPFTAHATTWLNERRWDDWQTPASTPKKSGEPSSPYRDWKPQDVSCEHARVMCPDCRRKNLQALQQAVAGATEAKAI